MKDQKALQDVLTLPETALLRDAAFTRFASQAAARFSRHEGADREGNTARIKNLLPDLTRFETKFLMTGTAGGDADWFLGIRLPEDRESEWRKELSALARDAGLQVKEEVKWTASTEKYRLSLERAGNWTLLRGGYSDQPAAAFSEFRKGLEQKSDGSVLAAQVDFPRLGQLWNAPRLSHAPRVAVEVKPNHAGLRSEIDLEYPRDLGIKLEKWAVPANLLSEPLVGFTAIQGVRESLQDRPNVKALELKKTPNQLFTWSVGDTPFSIYLAGDVGNPKEAIVKLMNEVLPKLTPKGAPLPGKAVMATNGLSMVWRGLPVVMPFAQVGEKPHSSFLVTGLFPVIRPETNKVPAALFEQLKKKNLIYYDWEITEGRLTQWRPIWQLAYIAGSPKLIRSEAPSEKWLAAVTPKLGNAITEATLESDRKIRVIRQSHIGMNALELVLLAHWLDPHDLQENTAASGPAPGVRQNPPKPVTVPRENAETRR